jgi:hypothetical protein
VTSTERIFRTFLDGEKELKSDRNH